ncbi:hypothetical protein YC2023_077733 [Brassica napus]
MSASPATSSIQTRERITEEFSLIKTALAKRSSDATKPFPSMVVLMLVDPREDSDGCEN